MHTLDDNYYSPLKSMIKLHNKFTILGLSLFAAININIALADAQFDLDLSGAIDGNPVPPKAQVLVQGGKVRIAFPDAPSYHEIIHDTATKRFALVDHSVQDVRYIDANTVGDLASQAQQVAKQMGVELNIGSLNDILSGQPKDGASSKISPTGETATIANATCEWFIFSAKNSQDRGCLVASDQLSFLSNEDRAALTDMAQTAKAISSQVSGIMGDQPAMRILADIGSYQLPLSWQGLASGVSFEVRAMESKTLPAGIADIPESYKTSPLM